LKSIATKSLIIPMNFVSMRGSSLDSKETFTAKKMTPEHWQLLGECLDHDLSVVPQLLRRFDANGSGLITGRVLEISAKRITNGLKKYVQAMRRGESPIGQRGDSIWLNPTIPDLNGS
jgi:hypothetical protein